MSSENHSCQSNYLTFKGKYAGVWGWLFSTDHKRIGILYLYSILSFFIAGAFLGLLMKLELIAPGSTIMRAQTYNGFFTLHGIVITSYSIHYTKLYEEIYGPESSGKTTLAIHAIAQAQAIV